ncbi:MspA family porin [Gordonia polyisoprenivorans]|uniref:MspA family porin n=1 Tax=Gordonia polyisoprenivorans TaxID=84595 RepID=UPI000B99D9BE|nr:MspA family porin [Gordonia polyisoprenivorans]OZC29424.1 hypothetical protein CJJ17_27035 [Gordonia polyisoprenivorans]
MSTIESPVRARRGALTAIAAGAIAAGITAAAAAPAHADTFVPLPNGSVSGHDLTLTRTNESAQVSPSLAANGAGRNVWVSANITLKAPKLQPTGSFPANGPAGEATMPGTNGTSNDGSAATLSAGYIIGCQVNVGSLTAGITGSITSAGVPGASGSLSVPLTPGQVTFVQIDMYDIAKAGTYYFNYQRFAMQIQNCAGYAQARSFVTVETGGNNHNKINLYGKPFSIG